MRSSAISGSTITGLRSAKGSPSGQQRELTVVYPPELRQCFSLGNTESVIGRDPGPGGLHLPHPTVSRSHARLCWQASRHTHLLADLASHNGSTVDGLPAATPRALVNQSLLRLGDVLLIYDVSAATLEDATEVSAEEIAGRAPSVQRLRVRIARAAKDPAPALIQGESGTGKERVARELHRLSNRRGPLLALNCATLSHQLAESELFGHQKGAFTGASEARPGLFRAANGGTLFLDEVGELPLELQPKLLRVLQEGEVLPVGDTRPVQVEVRVVAATHRNLAQAVEAGTFRQDLYARLALWEINLPALRERRVDLLDWIDRLAFAWATARSARRRLSFDPDAAEILLRFSWPLNLRGVERLVHELSSAMSSDEALTPAALPAWLTGKCEATGGSRPQGDTVKGRPVIPSRQEFVAAFEELDGNVRALARRFARDRRQIYRWIAAHGLQR